MSSTETEPGVQDPANEIASLDDEQLQELYKQYSDGGNETAANAIQAVIDERAKLNEAASKQGKAKKEPKEKKSRKGRRAPRGRQVDAAKSFNADPEQLARLKQILDGDPDHDPPIEPVIQPDGSYQMTKWLVQLGISGYYSQRRVEGVEAKAGESATAPIIPDATPDAPAAPASEAASTEVAPDEVAPTEPQAAVTEDPLPADAIDPAPQTATGFPTNPYGGETDTPDE